MNISYLKNKNIHFVECENWHDAYGYEKTEMKEDTINYIEQLQQENARLKDKLNDIEKILDADCCVENVYQAMCQYLNIHDYELDLEDYLKEN